MGTDTKMAFVFKKYKGENIDDKRCTQLYDVIDQIRLTLKASYKDFKEVDCSSFHGRSMWLRFVDGEDSRQIFMCLDCEADQLDKFKVKQNEQVINFSLGCWGNSTKIMETLGQALIQKVPGRVYIDFNDCDSTITDVFLTSAKGQK